MPHDFAIPGLMPLDSPIDDVTPDHTWLEPHDAINSEWAGIPVLGPYLIDGIAPAYPAASAVMVFTADRLHCQDWALVIGSDPELPGDVSIMLPDQWEFSVPPQPLPLHPGNWDWFFIVTDSRGEEVRAWSGSILIRV